MKAKRESSARIDDVAAGWATRIDDAALDDLERAEFEEWLEGDVRRVGAFARAQAVLVHVKRAKALGSEFEPEAFEPAPEESAPIDNPGPEQELEPATAPVTRRKWIIGASALAATGAIAFFIPARQASALVYETGKGEVRLVPLVDGSTVTLNTQSKIAVSIGDNRRNVQLIEGEALFKVAVRSAPFMVEAGDMSVRAENATFLVCRIASRPLEVTVCEGDVEVARASFASQATHKLSANRQATVPRDGAIIEQGRTPEALLRDLAWQEGMLAFEDTPLQRAAEEFARYSDRRIRIADPEVGSETVTGLYAANNPEGFARAVALSLDLRMQETRDGISLAR